jgi:hypothetical protein
MPDEIQISLKPFKRAGRIGASSAGAGVGILALAFYLLVQLVIGAVTVAALYWVSDQAYSVTWLLGFPIRLLSIAAAISFLFMVLGSAVSLIAAIGVALFEVGKAAVED